jgi:outer membrane immunogenic protein
VFGLPWQELKDMNVRTSKIIKPFAAAVGATALIGATSAFAADAIAEAPPAPAPIVEQAQSGWAGPYAGIQAGGAFAGRTRTQGTNVHTDGFHGRGFGGFNWQNGNFVYGIEGDVGYDDSSGSHNGIKSKGSVDGSLRGRAGYAPNDRILVYGTAGAAAKRLKIETPTSSDANGVIGWTAGAGIDAKLTEKVFARVEYRYTDYGKHDFNVGGVKSGVHDRTNTIEAGIGIKF